MVNSLLAFARLIFLPTAVLLGACAGGKATKIEERDLGKIAGKHLVTTVGDPMFTVMAPGGAAMPLSDLAEADTAGGQQVEVRNVMDPAIRIGIRLADYLESEHAMVLGSKGIVAIDRTVESLAEKLLSMSGEVDYILDVRTKIWEVRPVSAYANKYFVAYAAKIRLIDAGKQKIIAEGVCKSMKPVTEKSASLQRLRRDNGARLKSELNALENHCIGVARRDILSL